MNTPLKSLDIVFQKLERHAAATKSELHPSFRAELENYAGHKIVRDLDVKDLHVVIEKLGESAIKKSASQSPIIGGGAIRTVISDLCDNPFSDCSWAAHRVLEMANRSEAARGVRSIIEKRYGKWK